MKAKNFNRNQLKTSEAERNFDTYIIGKMFEGHKKETEARRVLKEASEAAEALKEAKPATSEAAEIAAEYYNQYLNVYSCLQAARSEAEKAEIRSRADVLKAKAAEYQKKAAAEALKEAKPAASDTAAAGTKPATSEAEARRVLKEAAKSALYIAAVIYSVFSYCLIFG